MTSIHGMQFTYIIIVCFFCCFFCCCCCFVLYNYFLLFFFKFLCLCFCFFFSSFQFFSFFFILVAGCITKDDDIILYQFSRVGRSNPIPQQENLVEDFYPFVQLGACMHEGIVIIRSWTIYIN